MYKYASKDKMYYFDGDLAEYLVDYGVSKEQIENAKNRTMEHNRDAYHNFPQSIKSKELGYVTLVPVDKIIGTKRATEGESVFDNVNQMKGDDRIPERFTGCFEYFKKMSLEELKKSYEELETTCEPVRMCHYVEEDAYFVTNGNHRSLTAMLVGADKIRAKVTDAHLDEAKKEKYNCEKAFRTKYNIAAIYVQGVFYGIVFNDGDRKYRVTFFPAKERSESVVKYVNKLGNIIDDDMKIAERLKQVPAFLRNPLLWLLGEKRHRIIQFIDKEYLDEKNTRPYRPHEEIRLYEL